MEIETERRDGLLLAIPQGRIDSAAATEFLDGLQDAIHATDRAVVVDLSRAPYISSAGLRALLTVAKATRQRGGDFAVCQLPEAVLDIFRLSGFDKIIAIYDSRTGALATLGGPR